MRTREDLPWKVHRGRDPELRSRRFAAGLRRGNAAGVHLRCGAWPIDQQARRGAGAQHRRVTERQVRGIIAATGARTAAAAGRVSISSRSRTRRPAQEQSLLPAGTPPVIL